MASLRLGRDVLLQKLLVRDNGIQRQSFAAVRNAQDIGILDAFELVLPFRLDCLNRVR